MTPKEFFDKMTEIEDEFYSDLEVCHSKMDDLMCEVLDELGYGDGVHVFKGADKWYA